jgi:amino acid adenylation domain-containing protein
MGHVETHTPVSTTLNLIDHVRAEFRDHPAACAIESATCRVTYAELRHQADSIAAMLRKSSCAPGDVIAALVADRAALIAVMLGVLQAGCIFVPLNDDSPAERLRHIVTWLKPKLFLASEANYAAVKRLAAGLEEATTVLTVPQVVEKIPDGESSLARAVSPIEIITPPINVPAYIYFTSGSTGQPKGIAGSLNNLARRIAWEINAFQIPRGFRVSQLITATFDPWFRDIFVPLCLGGTICIPPDRPARLRPEMLLEWLSDAKINLMHCGPTLLNTLVSTPPRIRRLPDLRLALLAGEFLHVSLVSRWRRRFGTETRLVNLYGATEATMMQFHHIVEPADLKRGFIPIGRPLPDVDILLTDEQGKRCAPGQIGEILVGGPTLSLGYFRDEEATRKAFIEVDMPDGSRMLFYRTGDLGMELDDGRYRLLGRRDDQVKIRGVRVEPREVEDALTGYPSVAACAVSVRQGGDSGPSLVAYIVPETEYPPATPEMRAYLRERLPVESVPEKFVLIKQLCLTDTGKIDRRMLPEPEGASDEIPIDAVAPHNPLETMLVKYWGEILGLGRVGVHDHFMDLGGHSLSAMRLLSRLSAHLGLHLSVADVLDNPTIAKLAARIETLAAIESRTTVLARPTGAAPISNPPSASPEPRAAPVAQAVSAATSDFACPKTASPLFGTRHCNLVLFLGDDGDRDSYERAARLVEEFDPMIYTEIVEDKPGWSVKLPSRPTLFFSPALIRNRPRIPGCISCGYPLSKSEEYGILAEAGISVPRWVTLREHEQPNLDGFGNYVVRKPDYGAKGAEVRIVKRGRVRWKRVVTSAAGPSPTLLVQEFIYTGLWPVSYRVNTLFGRVLYCMRITGNASRPALRGPNDFNSRGSSGNSPSIVANVRDSKADYCEEVDIIRLGERAARAFPDLPLLGVDVLKEASTGRLFVTEVNALGHNWNFSRAFTDNFGLDVAAQFDGLRKAAYVLAEETQNLANLVQNTDR